VNAGERAARARRFAAAERAVAQAYRGSAAAPGVV
jgi:hypothetical protein